MQHENGKINLNPLTLIRESWKNPKRGTITERVLREKIQSSALRHLYMLLCFGFFPKIALGDGPKKWQILFSTVYFRTY